MDLVNPDQPRLRAAAAVIQKLQPDVLLINEIAFNYDGSESNAVRFANLYLSVSQGPGLMARGYSVYQPETNTGVHSGMDLDNSGDQTQRYQLASAPTADGSPPAQSAEGRAYGNDSWGFGTFPGQYGMALFVRDDARIRTEMIRTWQHFRWSALPDALRPVSADGSAWYSDEEWELLRLSSKNHAAVPIAFEDGREITVIMAHPTPPAFDGPEQRNVKRNHDEIRLIREIIDGASFLVDDAGRPGGLSADEHFVVMGDLNADPDEGSSAHNPIVNLLLSSERVSGDFVPTADASGVTRFPDLDPDDSAQFGLRVDYILPSDGLRVMKGGIDRSPQPVVVSDHFPVWVDILWPDDEPKD